ncbi:cation:dicarboxylate symporter family transporter [Halioglobus pacificus]|uniref:ABC transporter substrate-binding protein n=1 Tax=Parahalioglobus pacificus TaxID=930806 RepID=A0A919CK55_9GAMM|nr:cation:dicarboxylase symporter family transporter [Halioglobus pacificus]GHD32647.1 ABC transporter substrate-binding protein [Halioglobus pacificus]
MGLSGRILLGLLLGVAAGLFFGELAAGLKIFGDIFVRLLQITVLPYIVVSLISGFARMDMQQAKRLALRGTLVLLAIWGLALVMIFTVSLAFPSLEAASFFSSMQGTVTEQTDLLELYLPANIFYSLSNNLVPAVVLFSILVGVALIAVEEKETLVDILDGLNQALTRINGAVVQLTPYGIFAIAAAAAGTMTIDELGRVQVYLMTYISLALLITFWIFPGLVATVSGIPFRQVLATFRDPLVTAFATGNQFVVLPQIAERCKALLAQRRVDSQEAESAIDIIVPVSFNFPSLGKLLVLLFVLFAAWFTDTPLNGGDRVSLAFEGFFSLFGSINIAVPYLLNALRIPADMFQLFLVTGIVVGRFGAMLAALHIIVVSVLGTLALGGLVRVRSGDVLRYLAVSGLCLVALVVGLRLYFSHFVPAAPPRDEVLAEIELMQERVSARIRVDVPEASVTQLAGTRLDHVLYSGILQVGYRPNNLPCSFLTPDGELVGFDVEMAHVLAEDLGVDLEFVPFEFGGLERMLASGQIDMAMSCIAALPDRFAIASFSQPYIDLHLSFVVLDHERELYADVEALRAEPELTIALVSSHYFAPRIHKLLPNAQVVYLEAAEDFFSGDNQGADALLLSAEEGAAYAYRYPRYTVARARDGGIRYPAAYAVPKGDTEMQAFVSNWVDLKRKDGTVDELHTYWMLGGVSQQRGPRWSIIRDVLGWID